jgi:hypothetical protein
MQHRTRWIAGFAAVLLTLTMAATAFAYNDTTKGSITVTAHGSCGTPVTLTATVLDANGALVSGQSVEWALVSSPSGSEKINKTPTVTHSDGVATTTFTLAPVSGDRGIRATAGDVSGSVVLGSAYSSCVGGVQGAQGAQGAVLPNTSTLPADTTGGSTAPLLLAIFVALAVVGGGLTLGRLATLRR